MQIPFNVMYTKAIRGLKFQLLPSTKVEYEGNMPFNENEK